MRISKHLLFLPAALVVVGFACGTEQELGQPAREPIGVEAVEVSLRSIEQPVAYSGTVEAVDEVRLSTKVMGWIEDIRVKEGDRVSKGATLVELRSEDIEAKRAQAEAVIAEAQAHFENAETNLARIEALFAKKAATQKELDDMKAAFASARARRDAALEMKKEVEEMLAYTRLTAPFDGVVTGKMLDVGDLANPGQPILRVESIGAIKVVAKVPESEIMDLKEGEAVEVEVPAVKLGANGQSVGFSIDRIVPAADPVSRQFDIHIVLDNAGGELKPGMFARVVVQKPVDATLLIPYGAVFRRGQLQGVYVIDSENMARLRWLRTGARFGDFVEVLSGLEPGQQVIMSSIDRLSDGQPVEVK